MMGELLEAKCLLPRLYETPGAVIKGILEYFCRLFLLQVRIQLGTHRED